MRELVASAPWDVPAQLCQLARHGLSLLHPPEPHTERACGVSAVGFPHGGSLVKQASPESWVSILAVTAAARPAGQGSGRLTFFHVVLELLFFITSPGGLGIGATVSQACGSLYSTRYAYLPSER